MEKETKSLTPRQEATYNLIVKNSEIGNSTTQKEICDNYPFDPVERKDGYIWNDSPKAHDHCTTVWSDINAINNDRSKKIIIYNNFVYWVPRNAKELKDFANSLYLKKAVAAFRRRKNLFDKAKRDGTIDLFEVDEYEAFIKNFLNDFGDDNGDD